jgi:hypothetical protein
VQRPFTTETIFERIGCTAKREPRHHGTAQICWLMPRGLIQARQRGLQVAEGASVHVVHGGILICRQAR